MFNKKNKFSRLFLLSVFLIFASVFLFGTISTVLAGDVFGLESVDSNINLKAKDPRVIATQVINISMSLLGVIALAIVIYAGFMWMTSEGQEDKIDKAKAILKAGVIGLIIILSAWGITTFVLNKLGGATGTAGYITCTDGNTRECGCDGVAVCSGGSWGACIGSTCLPGSEGSYCNNSSILGLCSPDNTLCNSGLVCGDNCRCAWPGQGDPCGSTSTGACVADDNDCSNINLTCNSTSCTCEPNIDETEYSELGETCSDGGSCSATENLCNPSHGLTCDTDSCKCIGNPVITAVSPVGGFCVNNINTFCEEDSQCPGSTCDKITPNAAKGNFITILGYNFNSYEPSTSKVNLIKGENIIPAQNPGEINTYCENTWTNSRIIVAIPDIADLNSGDNLKVEVVTRDGKNDLSDDDFGPKVENLKINNISRPGICGISEDSGTTSKEIYYYGTRLNQSQVYFGNLFSSVLAFVPNFLNSDKDGVAKVPSIKAGETSTFVKKSKINSNILEFTKLADAPVGPSISSFTPDIGSAGQYVTITGKNFGKYKGNNSVYLRKESNDTEVSFDFPEVCLDSVWFDGQILFKVPSGLSNGKYNLVLKISSWPDIISNYTFEVDSSKPLSPSVCKISPKSGPHNTLVSLWGEYFGVNSKAIFYKDKDTAVAENKPKDGADKIKVNVPANSITGPVKVSRENVGGNSVNFSVGSCSIDSDCSEIAQKCCVIGSPQAGACVAAVSMCFEGTPDSSAFQWKFTTGFNNIEAEDLDPKDSCSNYTFCPEGYNCPNSPGVCSNSDSIDKSSSCGCCCDKSKNDSEDLTNPECCAPLTCDYKCGISAQESTSSENFGLCSGCMISSSTTMTVRDSACNCPGTSGKYCDINDINKPTGVCLDCALLSEDSCKEHSATCCYDSTDNICRGGKSDATVWGDSSPNLGICPYYNCQTEDPTQCNIIKAEITGVYKNIQTCTDGCPNNCSLISNSGACKSKNSCCWNSSKNKCLAGTKYSNILTDTNYGLCTFYNCTVSGSACSRSITEGSASYLKQDTCDNNCRDNSSGFNTACFDYENKLCTDIFCNRLTCLNKEGSSYTENAPESCGVCCCDPARTDQCYNDLSCLNNKGNCTGPNRGLCCGCSSDKDCDPNLSTPSDVGCGFDTCCQARPKIKSNINNIGQLDVVPNPWKENVCRNAIIQINFDQRMDALSLEGNILLLQEKPSNSECPSGTQQIAALSETETETETNLSGALFTKLKKIFKKSLTSVSSFLGKTSMAADGELVYCSVLGLIEVDHANENSSSVYFKPNRLLDASSKYYVVVKGDEELNSQSGVKSFSGVGMNGKGFYKDYVYPYNELDGWGESDVNLFNFSGKAYKNSYIWNFFTMSVNTAGQGICEIEYLEMSPNSYLFQDNKNDINENDADAKNSSFDSIRDKDKAYYVNARTSDGQIIAPTTGYSWKYIWTINNDNIIEFNNDVVGWTPNSSNRLVQVKPDILEGKSNIVATVAMDAGNIINAGDGKNVASTAYILICKNPWPAIKSDGTWSPWTDISSFNNYNYEFYYCRDAGREGEGDDLPAFMTNSAIIKGNSLSRVCSNNSNINCSSNNDCPGNGLCLVNFLKETYLFRNAKNRVISSFEALDSAEGNSIRLSWISSSDNISRFLVYYFPAGSSANTSAVPVLASLPNCRKINDDSQYSCTYTLSGLLNYQSYNVRIVAVNSSSFEIGTSFYTSITPTFIPFVSSFTADDTTLGNELSLSWQSKSNEVTSYRVYFNGHQANIPLTGNCSSAGGDNYACQYLLKGLTNSTEYNLSIKALKAGSIEFGSSNVVSATPTYLYVPIVNNLSVTNTDVSGKVVVSWEARVNGVFDSYKVCSKLDENDASCQGLDRGDCSLSGEKYSCSLSLSSLTNNKEHKFFVHVINASQIIEVFPSPPFLFTPSSNPIVKNLSLIDSTNGGSVIVKWEGRNEADFNAYKICSKRNSENFVCDTMEKTNCSPLSSGKFLCSFTKNGLADNSNYEFKIESLKGSQIIQTSNSLSITPTAVNIVRNLSALDPKTGGKLAINWEARESEYFSGFKICSSLNGLNVSCNDLAKQYCNLLDGKYLCSFTKTGLANDSAYDIYIESFNNNDKVQTSNSVSATPTFISSITTFSAADTTNGESVVVNWGGMMSADFTEYKVCNRLGINTPVCIPFPKTSCTQLGNKYSCSFTKLGLSNGSNYDFYIQALKGSLVTQISTIIKVKPTFVSAITNFTAADTESGGKVALNWETPATKEFTKYTVCSKPLGEPISCFDVPKTLPTCSLASGKYSCAIDAIGLTDGQPYEFFIEVKNVNNGISEIIQTSAHIFATPTFNPILLNFLGVDTKTGGSVKLNWVARGDKEITGFNICSKLGGSMSCITSAISQNCALSDGKYLCSYVKNGLTDNSPHEFFVEAKKGTTLLEISNKIYVTPTLTPIFSNISIINNMYIGGSIKATWDARESEYFNTFYFCYHLNGSNPACSGMPKSSCALSGNIYSCSVTANNLINYQPYETYLVIKKGFTEIQRSQNYSVTPTFTPFVSNFTAIDAGTGGRINLSWRSPKNEVNKYRTVNGSGGSSTAISYGTSSCQIQGNDYVCQFEKNNLPNGQTQWFEIEALNILGEVIGKSTRLYATPTEPMPCPEQLEYNGYNYNIVQMKNSCWFAENLRTTKLQDGSIVENTTDSQQWINNFSFGVPSYSWYDNDSSSYVAFGFLYNRIAVKSDKLCPSGWHVPDYSEVDKMVEYLKGNNTFWCGGSSYNLSKSIAVKNKWSESSNICATGNDLNSNNSSGFSALPGGRRDSSDGQFRFIEKYTYFWTKEGIFYIGNDTANIEKVNGVNDASGFSVRCVMD